MFPNVNQKDDYLKDKIRQKEWDQRHNKGAIPDYSPLKDKHAKSYRKIINNGKTEDNYPSKEKDKMTYLQKRIQLMDQLKDLHPNSQEKLQEYQQLVAKYKIPHYYIYYQLSPLLSKHQIGDFLFKEIKSTKQKASHYHKIETAVKAREECLERLRKTINMLRQDTLEDYKNELKQQIKHYRFLTKNVMDQIKKWRDQIGQIGEKPIFYTETNQNYLIKLLNDNKFIFASKMSGVLNFAEKNDPYILVPLKRSEGKESSIFIDIFKLQQGDDINYQRYMEYLAAEKAHDLKVHCSPKPKEISKNPIIEKIYKTKNSQHSNNIQPKKTKKPKEKIEQDEEQYDKFQLQKARQDRLKKNDERMKSIKSIYQTFSSKKSLARQYKSQKKIAETDNQGREEHKMKKKVQGQKKKIVLKETDVQFQNLVKLKVQAERRQKKDGFKLKRDSKFTKSMTKINNNSKNEDKMIQNLKDIQSTLRSKLQIINQDEKKESNLDSTQNKFNKRTNQDLIKQLKSEIMSKMEKESQDKQRLRKRKRQEEEKILEEIKQKLKKQTEQKLDQKKKEKIAERQQLQKKLKQQEARLNNQRQLQNHLQLKLAKEKQLRELQKIRRQALQREKKFREELEKQKMINKEKQNAIQRERRQKERLIQELKKKQLREQIEDELKRQMRDRQPNRSFSDTHDLQNLKIQKQAELSKQIELLKLKENVEKEQMEKENQLRYRMLKLKGAEEELKRKQVQQLMKNVIQDQKQEIQRDAVRKRIQIEDNMRSNVKEKLLEQYKNQKQAYLEKQKYQKQKKLDQQVYRDKIKQKIEKQMRIQAIQKTKKELDDREQRKYQIKSKLDSFKTQFDRQIVIDKDKVETEVKKQLVEKVIFDKQAERQAAKMDLRSQFERQLMASAVPQIYESKDSFLIKNINHFEGDNHLSSKMYQNRPTNIKPEKTQYTQKKSEIKQLKSSLTIDQLHVYSKQKQKVKDIREEPINLPPTRLEQEGFQLVKVDNTTKKEEQEYDVRIIKRQSSKQEKVKQKKHKQSQKKKKKKKHEKTLSSQDSEDQIKHKKAKAKKMKQKRKNRQVYYESSSVDSEEVENKRKKNKKKRKQSSSSESEEEVLPPKKKLVYKTSEEQKKKEKQLKLQSKIKEQKQLQQQKIHYDAQNQQSKFLNSQVEPISIRQKKSAINQKFQIYLQAIPEGQFDEYLQTHISRLPDIQLQIQLIERQQLFRKLTSQLTFCLLIGKYQGRIIGMALAYHDRSKSDTRKFSIVHIATYRTEDLKDFILSSTNFIFRKDPADEIEFHFKFNESNEEENAFSVNFNKWFDKYGSVYQKKIYDTTFERKYVLKRQFNQKCEVVLGGVNKNTFRNIFGVYCGVLMSDSDMIQHKEQLLDTITPQNEICYSVMVAELFRTYLSPDEAESLKNKVKQFVKLKQMLVLVVMLQKKKVKMDDLKLMQYKNLIELNMKLMSQGKEVIRYCKDGNTDLNRIYYAQLHNGFNLPFHFQTTSLPVEAKQAQIRQISYFRLSPLPPHKLHIIKSSLYNTQMNILPTENSKYKIFVMNAQEYNEIKELNNIDLFMYIRLFLKNVKSHNVAVWKYVWMPEMTDKGSWNIRQFKSFLNKDFYVHDNINISYRQFLPGALIIEPEHRDLVITPPFIVGVMSMTLEQVTEGSPLYARMIDVDALKTLEIQQ